MVSSRVLTLGRGCLQQLLLRVNPRLTCLGGWHCRTQACTGSLHLRAQSVSVERLRSEGLKVAILSNCLPGACPPPTWVLPSGHSTMWFPIFTSHGHSSLHVVLLRAVSRIRLAQTLRDTKDTKDGPGPASSPAALRPVPRPSAVTGDRVTEFDFCYVHIPIYVIGSDCHWLR